MLQPAHGEFFAAIVPLIEGTIMQVARCLRDALDRGGAQAGGAPGRVDEDGGDAQGAFGDIDDAASISSTDSATNLQGPVLANSRGRNEDTGGHLRMTPTACRATLLALSPFIAVVTRRNRRMGAALASAGIGLAPGEPQQGGRGAGGGAHGALAAQLAAIAARRRRAGVPDEQEEGVAGIRQHIAPFLIGMFTGFMFGLPAVLCAVGGNLPPASRLGVVAGALISVALQLVSVASRPKTDVIDDALGLEDKIRGGHRTVPSGSGTEKGSVPGFDRVGTHLLIEQDAPDKEATMQEGVGEARLTNEDLLDGESDAYR